MPVIISLGLLEILKDNRVIGIIAILIIFGFLSYNVIGESLTVKPLISEQELDEIKELQKTEKEAYVMATHKNYSPWVLGYSERKTIAPGLFEYNQHGTDGWNGFWRASNYVEAKEFLDAYPRPLYIHVGNVRQGMNMTKFEDRCFEPFVEGKIWKIVC